MPARLVILGAGGHARVVAEAARLEGRHTVVGFVDSNERLHGGVVLSLPVLGGDEALPELAESGVTGFIVGVGSVGDASSRIRLFEAARALGLEPATVVHPAAVVSPSAKLGSGSVVLAGAVVNAQATVGRNVIVNTRAVVEHDCAVQDHVHIATGAELASGVTVGAAAHIGAGATVIQGLRIGARAVVGAGAVVIRDVDEGTTVFGCPAQARALGHSSPEPERTGSKAQ